MRLAWWGHNRRKTCRWRIRWSVLSYAGNKDASANALKVTSEGVHAFVLEGIANL